MIMEKERKKCILFGQTAEYWSDFHRVGVSHWSCPNCEKFITWLTFDLGPAPTLSAPDKALLSGYVRIKNDKYNEEPEITGDNYKSILNGPGLPRTPIEKADVLLLWFYDRTKSFGEEISITTSPFFPTSICYAINSKELLGLIDYLDKERYIQLEGRYSQDTTYSLTFLGHQKCQMLRMDKKTDTLRVFVAMCFKPEYDTVYSDGILPAIEECGFSAFRVDNYEHNNDITDEIIAGIKNSRFIVADLSGYRAGVYYEAGFARGLGLPVIMTCRKDWFEGEVDKDGKVVKERIHFDVNHLNIIIYEEPDELKMKLINRIKASIL